MLSSNNQICLVRPGKAITFLYKENSVMFDQKACTDIEYTKYNPISYDCDQYSSIPTEKSSPKITSSAKEWLDSIL
jgi:hypothetical protein